MTPGGPPVHHTHICAMIAVVKIMGYGHPEVKLGIPPMTNG